MNDQMAIRHNDISVLENHHLAAAFQLIESDEAHNWMINMDRT